VVSVDPGLATGYNYWLARDPNRLGSGWESAPLAFLDWFDTFVHSQAGIVVVCEDFTINASTVKKPDSRYSLEVLGTVRYLTAKSHNPLVLQSPADAKSFSSDSKLRALGWNRPGRPHATDANRHLLLYFARMGWYDGRQFRPKIANRLDTHPGGAS
jgi:hypothetical protein